MGNVLIAVTNHQDLKQMNDTTGLWFSELTKFYDKVKHRHKMTIISPSGGESPLDHRSLTSLFLSHKLRKYYRDSEFQSLLKNTLKPEEVNPDHYDAIYFTGGHGTMWDFPENEGLQRLTRGIYENNGIVAAVCHGPSALLHTKLTDGTPLLTGKRVTGFSNAEEKAVMLHHEIPFSLQEQLTKRAASYHKAAIPFKGYVETDGRLITGQNPASVKKVAKEVIKLIEHKEFQENPGTFRAVLRVTANR